MKNCYVEVQIVQYFNPFYSFFFTDFVTIATILGTGILGEVLLFFYDSNNTLTLHTM